MEPKFCINQNNDFSNNEVLGLLEKLEKNEIIFILNILGVEKTQELLMEKLGI